MTMRPSRLRRTRSGMLLPPAERKAAVEAYRKALSEAMAKVDPSIAPILDKLNSAQPPATAVPVTSAEEKQK